MMAREHENLEPDTDQQIQSETDCSDDENILGWTAAGHIAGRMVCLPGGDVRVWKETGDKLL